MAAPAIHLKWFNPVQLEWGCGLLRSLQPTTPFFVLADPAAVSMNMQADLKTQWGEHCLFWVWQESPQSSMDAALDICQKLWPLWTLNPDAALLAIGGGTTLDLAKVARFRLPHLETAPAVWRSNKLTESHQRHALWCAPTTSGTGSEVTPGATLWDLETSPPLKRSWSMPQGFADRALIDPTLTLSCPEHVTRDTALDTLAHALESIWNLKANDLTRPLAIQAAQIVLSTLPKLMKDLHALDARVALSKASLLAGLAMSQTQTALAHALSYELTLTEKLPHGHACAVWLPMVMEMATRRSQQAREDLALVFGSSCEQACASLSDWLLALGITPRHLQQTEADQQQLQRALGSARGRNFIEGTL